MMPLPGVLSSIIYMIAVYGMLTDRKAAKQTVVNVIHSGLGLAQYPNGHAPSDAWFNHVCADVRDDVMKLSVDGIVNFPRDCPNAVTRVSQYNRKWMASCQPIFYSLVDRWVIPGPKVSHSAAIVFDGFVRFAPSQIFAITFSSASTFLPDQSQSISYNHSHVTIYSPAVDNVTVAFHSSKNSHSNRTSNVSSKFCSWPFYKQFLGAAVLRNPDTCLPHRVMNRDIPQTYLNCDHPVTQYTAYFPNTCLHGVDSLASMCQGKDSKMYIPCWNECLRWAVNLFQKQGPWDVTQDCITAVQHLTVKMLRDFSPQIFKYISPRMESKVFRRILEEFEPVYWKSFSIIQQLFVFPPFKRFVLTAEERASKSSVDRRHAAVSCRGLEGTVSSSTEDNRDNLVLGHDQ